MTMTWFKFLAADGLGPFSGYRWPLPHASDVARPWTAWNDAVEPCRGGLHLLRQADLPFWIHEELYVAEVEGDVIEQESFVLARRARLVRRAPAWGRQSAYRFSCDCAWRVRDKTVEALRRGGRNHDADLLSACVTMDHVAAVTRGLRDNDGNRAGRLVGYAGDAATSAAAVRTSGGWAAAAAATAFVAAASARFAEPASEPAAAAERALQARWIADTALADR